MGCAKPRFWRTLIIKVIGQGHKSDKTNSFFIDYNITEIHLCKNNGNSRTWKVHQYSGVFIVTHIEHVYRSRPMAIAMAFLSLYWLSFFSFSFLHWQAVKCFVIRILTTPAVQSQLTTSTLVDVTGIF